MFEFLTATAAHRSSLGVDIAVDFFLVPFIHRCITENIPRNLMLMGSSNASIAQLPKYVKCAGGPFRGVFCGSRGGMRYDYCRAFCPASALGWGRDMSCLHLPRYGRGDMLRPAVKLQTPRVCSLTIQNVFPVVCK